MMKTNLSIAQVHINDLKRKILMQKQTQVQKHSTLVTFMILYNSI